MQKVHLAPLWSVVAGVAGLALIDRLSALSAAGWCAGLLYLGVSNALLARGLRRSAAARFGPANATTAARSTLVGLVTDNGWARGAIALVVALVVPLFLVERILARISPDKMKGVTTDVLALVYVGFSLVFVGVAHASSRPLLQDECGL